MPEPELDSASNSQSDTAPTTTSRRKFLLDAGIAVGGAALAAPLGLLPATASAAAAGNPNWDQLDRTIKGELLRPHAPGYSEAIKIRNARYASTRPAGVALVTNAGDVRTAIKWARDNEVEMVTRSGGHNYAGYSTTPGLVINLNAMTNVTFDKATGNLTTFGAALNGDVNRAGKLHGRALPGGQCPEVGISGFVLGGGLGFNMRQYGLGIDSLLATEMVTADGELLRVSDREYPDLFWALRGGAGGNFGINTSFTFRTFLVPNQVISFSLTWEGERACSKAFLAFQEVLRDAPNTMGAITRFQAQVGTSGAVLPHLTILGQIVETKDATEKLFGPVVAAAIPETTEFKVMSFWDAKGSLAELPNAPRPFAERSRFHPKSLPEAGVATIVAALAKAPISSGHDVSSSLFAWGGAVNDVPATATAFVHRNDVWLQAFDYTWELDSPKPETNRLIEWQNKFYDDMGEFASDRAFQNFPDPQLENPLQSYYGENLARLIKVKQKYDPDNVFHYAQSIPA